MKIDLKAILTKHSKQHKDILEIYPDYDIKRISINGKDILSIIEEVWNTAVDECKKSATVGYNGYDWIVKDIEKVKQMIL